ncbi:hypothetical protein EW093_11025 [Thiospirochaeta perfilievii]|uniref:Uncharacterized protein n=1 Tax=Thiospirochaeta perfilievii TaxID=252967 RepID=A0A5C1QDS1_9SPIO|nr:hypothetical protein [Thiospirochaeta perfilievii]QEN05220.1 hypothetical protein EW093_11025 [Thiospirochaeta perfilievii]
MNKYFNSRRFGLLCKNEVLSNYKSWGLYFITIVGSYTVLAMLITAYNKFTGQGVHGYDPNTLNYLFPGFLFIGGYIVSSLKFSDINDKFKSSLWFSLPGSTFEKYSVGVIVSSIGYSIFIIVSFIVASAISNIFTRPFFGSGMSIFNPLILGADRYAGVVEYSASTGGVNVMVWVLIYVLTNSIFLVGSIVFRKGAFIKTLLVSSVVQTLLSIILGVIIYFTFRIGITDSWDVRIFESIFKYLESHTDSETFNMFMLKWTLLFLIPISLFFNVVGYFKLEEKEVKGGI